MQLGSRFNEDQDATRIKIQRGSRYNEDQDATMHVIICGGASKEALNLFSIISLTKLLNVKLGPKSVILLPMPAGCM